MIFNWYINLSSSIQLDVRVYKLISNNSIIMNLYSSQLNDVVVN